MSKFLCGNDFGIYITGVNKDGTARVGVKEKKGDRLCKEVYVREVTQTEDTKVKVKRGICIHI